MNFKTEVFFKVFDDHHKVRELNSEHLLWVGRGSDVSSAHIEALDFKDQRVDIAVSESLDVSVSDLG